MVINLEFRIYFISQESIQKCLKYSKFNGLPNLSYYNGFTKKQFWSSCVPTLSSLVLGVLHFGFISPFTKFKIFACMELFELGDNVPHLMSSFVELGFSKQIFVYWNYITLNEIEYS